MTTSVSQSLAGRLNEMCDAVSWHTGWYFKDLSSGFSANRNGDVTVPSASTRKVAILMETMKQVHEGKLRLDQPVRMEAKYQNNTSGTFQHLAPGFTITLNRFNKPLKTLPAGRYSITVSDKSSIHNFHLKGPVSREITTVGFVGTKTVILTLKKGKYTFVCDPHFTSMHGSFTVT